MRTSLLPCLVSSQDPTRSAWTAISLLLLVSCLAWLAPGAARAQNTYDLRFETSGQNMWGPGDAFLLDEEIFLGSPWNAGPATIGGIAGSVTDVPCVPVSSGCLPGTGITIDTRTGGTATVSTQGRAGFNVGTTLDSGSVNAQVSYQASLTAPTGPVAPGSFFSLAPTQAFSGPQSLNANLSEASGKVEAVLGVTADLGGTGCFIPFGCASGSTTVGFAEQTVPLVSFNDPGSPGEIKIFGVADPALFQFGSPIEIPPSNPAANLGNITVHVPDVNASTSTLTPDGKLQAMDSSDFLDLRVDLDGTVLFAVGLPPILGTSVSAGPLNVGYDLVDIEFGPTFDLIQAFELDPDLFVELSFDRPVQLMSGDEVSVLTSRFADLPEIALLDDNPVLVTPKFFLSALFGNETKFGVDGVFTIDLLTAAFSLEAFGLSLDIGEIGLGRVVDERGDLFDFPTLFSNQFELGGWNMIMGESFLIGVPEPGTVLLLATGLIGLALGGRRRTRC